MNAAKEIHSDFIIVEFDKYKSIAGLEYNWTTETGSGFFLLQLENERFRSILPENPQSKFHWNR